MMLSLQSLNTKTSILWFDKCCFSWSLVVPPSSLDTNMWTLEAPGAAFSPDRDTAPLSGTTHGRGRVPIVTVSPVARAFTLVFDVTGNTFCSYGVTLWERGLDSSGGKSSSPVLMFAFSLDISSLWLSLASATVFNVSGSESLVLSGSESSGWETGGTASSLAGAVATVALSLPLCSVSAVCFKVVSNDFRLPPESPINSRVHNSFNSITQMIH